MVWKLLKDKKTWVFNKNPPLKITQTWVITQSQKKQIGDDTQNKLSFILIGKTCKIQEKAGEIFNRSQKNSHWLNDSQNMNKKIANHFASTSQINNIIK